MKIELSNIKEDEANIIQVTVYEGEGSMFNLKDMYYFNIDIKGERN